jgi:hypothetical protein
MGIGVSLFLGWPLEQVIDVGTVTPGPRSLGRE